MSKVPWSDADVLHMEEEFGSETTYAVPNDESKVREFEEWKAFRGNDYYDGTPAPDFARKIDPCGYCGSTRGLDDKCTRKGCEEEQREEVS